MHSLVQNLDAEAESERFQQLVFCKSPKKKKKKKNYYDKAGMEALANVPSREELLGKLLEAKSYLY